MNLKFTGFIICLSFLITQYGNSQESQILSKPGLVPEVHGVLEKPTTPGIHPAVIILYGSGGWRPEYVTIAKDLADSGFVALVLDYYAGKESNTGQGSAESGWPQWQASIRSAVTFLMDDSSITKGSVGLLGYSLGAFLAVSTASSIPEVKAVVDYFGGGSEEKDMLESEVRCFPPLLILHGEEDNSVPVLRAYSLRDAVIAQGGEVEMKIYPNAPHGFNATWSPYYSESYAIDSFQRTVDFFAENYLIKIMKQPISDNPYMRRMVPEFNEKLIRKLIESNYRIIYRINSDIQVDILRVYHVARLLKKKNLK